MSNLYVKLSSFLSNAFFEHTLYHEGSKISSQAIGPHVLFAQKGIYTLIDFFLALYMKHRHRKHLCNISQNIWKV